MSEPKPKRAPRAPAPIAAAPTEPVASESVMPAATAAPTVTAPVALPPVPQPARRAAAESSQDLFAFGRHALTALAESQAAVARGIEAMAVEMAGLARNGIAAASDSATALLGARTFADAFEVNVGFARRNVDAAIAGSAKLSEIGVKLTTEAARPLLSRLGEPRSAARFG